jgi:predicted ABC-type sugar transport system permease subunit
MSAQTDEIVERDEPGRGEPAEGLAALRTYLKGYAARVLGGELGSIPALVGLIVITVVFAVLHQGFLSAFNIEALVIQAAPIIVMAMGLVFVLLLGEIDLSAGTTGGLCSAITAVLILRQGAPWWLALIVGLVAGLAIGFGMGWLRARLGIPSFVVTLATFLAFQGITLILIGGQGSVILPGNSPLIKLENSFVPLWLGWTLLALLVAGYAAVKLNDALGRRRAGLSSPPFTVIAAKVVALAAVGAVFTYEMGINRNLATTTFFSNKAQGMPWVVVLLVILFLVWNFVLNRHPVWPARVRGRRQRGGLAPGRRGRVPRPDLRVRHLLRHGGRLRHDRGLAAAVGAVERRRRQHAAAGGRRGRDRRHLTVRRLRSRHRRRSRRAGRRGRHQRHERPHPGCELGRLRVGRHRRGVAARRRLRRGRPPGAGRLSRARCSCGPAGASGTVIGGGAVARRRPRAA